MSDAALLCASLRLLRGLGLLERRCAHCLTPFTPRGDEAFCPRCLHQVRILSGTLPAGTNTGSSGSTKLSPPVSAAAISSSCPKEYSCPSRIH